MPGLIETFDMAKRMAIFEYISLQLGTEVPYSQLLQHYRMDFPDLARAMSTYRTECIDSARRKLQTGLVSLHSNVSLNKCVRVGSGLGLFRFDFDTREPRKGTIRPNNITYVVQSLSQIAGRNMNQGFSFELHPLTKVLFFMRLMKVDSSYIVPLVYSVHEYTEGLKMSEIRQRILPTYARHLLSSFRYSLSMPSTPYESAKSMYGRLNFIATNAELLKRGLNPKRGFLHLVDPRLHWLYDLDLVDREALCNEGIVRTSSFWNVGADTFEEFLRRTMKNLQDVLLGYSKTLWPDRREDLPMAPAETIVSESVRLLSRVSPQLIPFESVRCLSQVRLLLQGVTIERAEIVKCLKKEGYAIRRDYKEGEGYVETQPRS